MALTDVILAPYAAAKDVAQSMNPVMLAALVAVVVVVNVVAAKSWQARRSRLDARTSNNGDGLAFWLISRFDSVANFTAKLALASELMELPLPIGPVTDPVIAATIKSPQEYSDPAVQAWSQAVITTPAFVILTPQYNWGYPGQLKNLLDHLYSEWKNKPVVLVTYGGHGGSKCAEQLRVVLSGGFHINVVAHVGISLPKEFIRSSDRVDAADVPSFLAKCETQVDEAFATLLKCLQH
ncbi:NAD(P)H-dependent FMN reductase LOT6 [Phytophthora nicotianae]|uniref:NAD(P)H-dependent FMN reductase LOT6 n=1 Tax=Phytophthora nicotianae TaxID=4792 RepID=A0A0W8CDG0_PHYNI|nr:NAD(P)H-dependent FMN reductase LOT6 [Phytophthora nicotianae]